MAALCNMQDLSSPGIEPVSPVVEAWNLSSWTTTEVPSRHFSQGICQCLQPISWAQAGILGKASFLFSSLYLLVQVSSSLKPCSLLLDPCSLPGPPVVSLQSAPKSPDGISQANILLSGLFAFKRPAARGQCLTQSDEFLVRGFKATVLEMFQDGGWFSLAPLIHSNHLFSLAFFIHLFDQLVEKFQGPGQGLCLVIAIEK